jgi:hypothetical protein
MGYILTIAKWEVLRLRSRFNGKSGLIIVPVLLLALSLSYLIYHQDFAVNKGFYTIGVVQMAQISLTPALAWLSWMKDRVWRLYIRKDNDAYIGRDKVLLRRDRGHNTLQGPCKNI